MTATNHPTEMLSVRAVCGRLSVSRTTLWRWSREGDFPKPVELSPATRRWRASEIDAWIASRERAA